MFKATAQRFIVMTAFPKENGSAAANNAGTHSGTVFRE